MIFLCLVCPVNQLKEHCSYRLREASGSSGASFLPPTSFEVQDKPGAFPGQFVVYLFSVFISSLV
jgi:hypothetical protein